MNNLELFKSMSIDEFCTWLDEHANMGSAPWELWFDKNYCRKCETVTLSDSYEEFGLFGEQEYCWCELHNKCKFYPDMAKTPSRKQTIRLWLESEY